MSLVFADLFCGAGGATTGVLQAAARLGIPVRDGVAINHWPTAVETHTTNHPRIRHLCEAIERVDPTVAVPGGRLDLLWASPECTHHSVARGGRPRQNQSRAGASHVLTWLDKLRVSNLIVENVREFEDWGPLNENGYPIQRLKGASFRAFIQSIQARNYRVEHRVLNAADYGDATTRRRLFIVARKMPARITWPEPSHGRDADLFSSTAPYRTARQIIDWSDKGKALSQRRRPLASCTMRRISEGLRRFCGIPFVLGQQSGGAARPVDEPIPTITCGGAIALCQPFLVKMDHTGEDGDRLAAPRSVDEPVPTVVTKQNLGLVTPFLTKYYGTATAVSVDEPLDTVTTKDRHLLVIPKLEDAPPAQRLEIFFRLLRPDELARAHSFPADYQFAGTKADAVKQIGNSNPVGLTAALTAAVLS